MSSTVKPVGASLKVNVQVAVCPCFRIAGVVVIVTTGAAVSSDNEMRLLAVFPFPEASVKALSSTRIDPVPVTFTAGVKTVV